MKNFYYVQSYNVMHPAIRTLLNGLGVISIHDSLQELKIRSKHFLGFHEATTHAQNDFSKKVEKIWPKNDPDSKKGGIKVLTIMNPKFAMQDALNEMIDERFGKQHARWDDDCVGTLFFCDAPESEDEDEFPKTWMMKYEIFFEEDVIHLQRKNGEYAFDPAALAFSSYTSAVH